MEPVEVKFGQSIDDFLDGMVHATVIRADGKTTYRFKAEDLTAIYEAIREEVLASEGK